MVEPWLVKLSNGDSQTAWDLFVARYRPLILATIRRLVTDGDDVMDVFSTVCQALVANDFARLKRYSDQRERAASVATWLVAVVRNLTVDWLRQRDGRRRKSVPPSLSPLHHDIYAALCIDGLSYVEAYEMICTRSGAELPFHHFLREVRAAQRLTPCPDAPLRRGTPAAPSPEAAAPEFDPAETAESARHLAAALALQPADVRLAVELFVVEGMGAADVARAVGWPNAKAVYNRVYRTLEALRAELARQGLGPGDL